ncbi:MAG: response regulator, partial [Clostridia bacterium]|nr:response regulator [Clostridia bacterium]
MAKYRVLLADDNSRFTDMMKGYLLAQENISEVDTAADGKEALQLLKDKRYDVLTLDLIMPNV